MTYALIYIKLKDMIFLKHFVYDLVSLLKPVFLLFVLRLTWRKIMLVEHSNMRNGCEHFCKIDSQLTSNFHSVEQINQNNV